MKRIAITGAGGFLGQHLVKQLLKLNDIHVYALTSQKETLNQLFAGNSQFQVVDEIPYEADILVNCAFPRNFDGVQIATGLHYLSEVYRETKAAKVKSVINISSQSVYSETRNAPACEDTELNLETKYAVGKYAMELMTNTVFSDIPHTNLRMASLIGYNFDQRLVNKFVKQVVAGNELSIPETDQMFGFMDVRDAASAICSVIASDPLTWDNAYNVGVQGAYSIKELAEHVVNYAKMHRAYHGTVKSAGTVDWKSSEINCDKFYEHFTWKPRYTIDDTIEWLFEG